MHHISQFFAEIRQKIVGGGVAEPLKSLCFGALVICVFLNHAYAAPAAGVVGPGDFGEAEVIPSINCSLVTCYRQTQSDCTNKYKDCCSWENNLCHPNCETYGINSLQPGCYTGDGVACRPSQYFSNGECKDCKNMLGGDPAWGNTMLHPTTGMSGVISDAAWSPHTGIVEESGKCPWQISCNSGNYIGDRGCTLCDFGYISPSRVEGVIYYPSDETHPNVCQPCYAPEVRPNGSLTGNNIYDVKGLTSNEKRTACDHAAVKIKNNSGQMDGDEYSYIYIADKTSKSVPDGWFDDNNVSEGGVSRTYTAGQCRALECTASTNKNPNSLLVTTKDCSTKYIYKIGDEGQKMQVVPGEPIRTLKLVHNAPCPRDYYCPGGTSADPIPCGNGMVTNGTGATKPTDCMITGDTEFCDSRGCFKLPIGDKKIPAFGP